MELAKGTKASYSQGKWSLYFDRLWVSYELSSLDLLVTSGSKRRISEASLPIISGDATLQIQNEPRPPIAHDLIVLNAEMVQCDHQVLLRNRHKDLTLGSLSEFEVNLWKEWLSEHDGWPVAMFLAKSKSEPMHISPYASFTWRARKWPVSKDNLEVDLRQDLEDFSESFERFISLERELDGLTQILRGYLNSLTGVEADKDLVGWNVSQTGLKSDDLKIFDTFAEEVVIMYKAATRMSGKVQEFDILSSLLVNILNFLEHMSLYLRATKPSYLWGVLDWSYDPGTFFDSVSVFKEATVNAVTAGWTKVYLSPTFD
jgi:hypothetical protein